MTIGLLVNPAAGRGAGRRAGERVRAEVRAGGHTVLDLSGGDLATATARVRANADELDALVVVGGDGLVHAAVQAVADTGVALGIVAAGTGNDIARGLDLPLGAPERGTALVLEALAAGRVRELDAVRVGSDDPGVGPFWYVSALASGVDALVNERANRWRFPRGPARYTLAAVRELVTVRPLPLRLVLDPGPHEHVVEQDVLLVALANTRSYGGGLTMAPGADPTDGVLQVVVVDALSGPAALRVLPRVRSGGHLNHPAVHVHRARRVRLEPGEDTAVLRRGERPARRPLPHADGEPLAPLPLTCEVVRGALRVLA
ncbi:diacylglycerol/lipid kinase family protein [Kineococcus gynurae]|uniref:Diacylglycerol/lipid kinase family protein n=1 Tax=Kineococcus gynurae TaxID=452979 RepID=A0ABV5LQW3_9ACTN